MKGKRRIPAAHQGLPGTNNSTRNVMWFVVVLVLGMLLYPIGTNAASYLNTIISDPINRTQQARVDAVGNLQVGGTVNVAGSVNVGSPKITLGIPATQFSERLTGSGEPQVASGPDPAGTNYAITSLTLSNEDDAYHKAQLRARYGTFSDCRASGITNETLGPEVVVAPHDSVHLTLAQPFVMSALTGANSCLVVDRTDFFVSVAIVGYTF